MDNNGVVVMPLQCSMKHENGVLARSETGQSGIFRAGGKPRPTHNARSGIPRRPALLTLVLLLLVGLMASREVTLAGTCPPVQNTLEYTIVYGDVTVDGQPAAEGDVVEARNGDGVVAGCSEVTTAGSYGAMYVFGEDTSVAPPIPGMRDGETIAFFVNGAPATADPELAWSNDHELHPVNLSAALPPSAASLELSPASGSYNVGDQFDVNVVLNAEAYEVAGVDVHLDFDPAKLRAQNFSEADLGTCSYLGKAIDNGAGTITFSVIIPLGGGEGCLIYDHPQGVIVGTIGFSATGGGTAGVTFDFTPGEKTDSNVSAVGRTDDVLGSVTNGSYSLCYNFNDTPGVDIGDVQLIAGAWRATDAGLLADYDFNGNSVVDIGDIMTVAQHLGEPCP